MRTTPCTTYGNGAGVNEPTLITTDAVSMALMGFDPLADRGTPPFEKCDSTLRLAEDVRLGTPDLKRIEVIGTPILQAMFDFGSIRKQRRSAPPPAMGIRG